MRGSHGSSRCVTTPNGGVVVASHLIEPVTELLARRRRLRPFVAPVVEAAARRRRFALAVVEMRTRRHECRAPQLRRAGAGEGRRRRGGGPAALALAHARAAGSGGGRAARAAPPLGGGGDGGQRAALALGVDLRRVGVRRHRRDGGGARDGLERLDLRLGLLKEVLLKCPQRSIAHFFVSHRLPAALTTTPPPHRGAAWATNNLRTRLDSPASLSACGSIPFHTIPSHTTRLACFFFELSGAEKSPPMFFILPKRPLTTSRWCHAGRKGQSRGDVGASERGAREGAGVGASGGKKTTQRDGGGGKSREEEEGGGSSAAQSGRDCARSGKGRRAGARSTVPWFDRGDRRVASTCRSLGEPHSRRRRDRALDVRERRRVAREREDRIATTRRPRARRHWRDRSQLASASIVVTPVWRQYGV